MELHFKRFFCFNLFLFMGFKFFLFANGKRSSQVIKTGHWIYDDLTLLATESKTTMILETQPMSVGEIKFYLNDINYSELSDSGKRVYERVQKFLCNCDGWINTDDFLFKLNLRTAPELYYKSNEDIDWSFIFNFNDYFLTMPVIIGYSDFFTFQSDFYYGKNAYAASLPKNFTNLPIKPNEINFYFPDFSYFSFNKTFDNWGISSHMGKKGLKLGNTFLGSIIYNNTFETDFYFQLNLYNRHLKYSMDVTQIDNTKYIYIHQLTFRPLKNLNLGILEGSLLNAPFELRYLNPFMVMHNFGSWREYNEKDRITYGEAHFCAYLGLSFEFLPIPNLRIYGLYAQNEMFDPGAKPTPDNLSVPSSIGGQLGAEYYFPLDIEGDLKTGLEFIYTSPFLYVKHSPDWSMCRIRPDVHSHTDYSTWIGSPLGPDSFIVSGRVEYNSNKQWKVAAGYNFSIHGENRLENIFNEKNKVKLKDKDGKETGEWYWNYYPSVKYRHTKEDDEAAIRDAVRIATNMWMSGISEYKNDIILNGSYRILDNLNLKGQFIYSFIFNNKNIANNFSQGVEISIAATYELF